MNKLSLLTLDSVSDLQSFIDSTKTPRALKLNEYAELIELRYFESNYDLDEKYKLSIPVDANHFRESDIENSLTIQKILPNIPGASLRDDSLWTTLAFNHFFDYMVSRWPLPNDSSKARSSIVNHYFLGGSRSLWRDHGITRLWWLGRYASRFSESKPREILEVIYSNSEFANSFLGRPTTISSFHLSKCILEIYRENFGEDLVNSFDRNKFREFMKEIDLRSGAIAIDSLSVKDVKSFVEKNFARVYLR